MRRQLANVFRLGVKELWSLWRDPAMLLLIVYTFTVAVYTAATAMPETLNKAPIAIVDEDVSPLSARIAGAFYPPLFRAGDDRGEQADAGMDAGLYTFVLDIPPISSATCSPGTRPTVQLNVDATRMSQAFTGSGYVQQHGARRDQRVRRSATAPVPCRRSTLRCARASTRRSSTPGSAASRRSSTTSPCSRSS
jgi:ABC-2 type transport system permease protein